MASESKPANMDGKGMVVGMNKGILFDVDGTLWDSAAQVAESWNEVLARYPRLGVRITAQDMYDNMGKTMMDIGKTLFPGLSQEECRKVMEECMTYENHYLLSHPGVLYPETRESMACLSRQYGLYIVSNCQSGYIEVLLESCGLREYVRDIECYGNTGLPKGDNIRMVVQRNHLERCFYVGDTHMDEEAAGAAGIPFVHAAYGFGRVERPVGTIESLSQLTALAKKLLD
nr:HAD family hydrolase [Enterocloster bolteae]